MDEMEWNGPPACTTDRSRPNRRQSSMGDDEKITMAEARRGAAQNILNNDKMFIVSQYVTLVFPTV